MKYNKLFLYVCLISFSNVIHISAFPKGGGIPSLEEIASSTNSMNARVTRNHTGISDMKIKELIGKEADRMNGWNEALNEKKFHGLMKDAFDDIIDQEINDLTFSPDCNLMVAGLGKAVKIWARQKDDTFRLIQVLYEHDDSIDTVAFSSDSKLLATLDGAIRIWARQDNNTFQLLQVLECHYDRGYCSTIAFSPDGAVIAAGCSVYGLEPNDPTTYEIKILKRQIDNTFEESESLFVQSEEGCCNWINEIAFSPDSTLLACSMYNSSDVMMWSIDNDKTFKFYQKMRCYDEYDWKHRYDKISALSFSHDSATLAIGFDTYAESVDILLLPRDENAYSHLIPCAKIPALDAPYYCSVDSITFSDDDRLLACIFADEVRILSRRNNGNYELRHRLGDAQGETPEVIALSSDGKLLATGYYNGAIHLWSLQAENTVKFLSQINHPDNRHFFYHVCCTSGNFVTMGVNSDIQIWSRAKDNTVTPLKMLHIGLGLEEDAVHAIDMSSDDTYMVTGSENGVIRIWLRSDDGQSFQLIQTLGREQNGHDKSIEALCLSADNRILISSSIDNVVKVWIRQEDNAFTCTSTASDHYPLLKAVALSRDAKYAAFIMQDGAVTIGLEENGAYKDLQTLHLGTGAHKNWMSGEWEWLFAFSRDNKFLATVAEDNSITIWARQDDNTFQFYRALNNRLQTKQLVKVIYFDSESQFFVSMSYDGGCDIWHIEDKKEFSIYSYILAFLGMRSA